LIVVEGRRRGGWFWFFGQTRKLKIADKNMKKSETLETPAVAAHILDQVNMLLLQSKKSWKNAGKIQRPLLHYCIYCIRIPEIKIAPKPRNGRPSALGRLDP
jgi:hypothetical protein